VYIVSYNEAVKEGFVLTIYRRHRKTCAHKDDRLSKKCRCALWMTGTVEGRAVRESLKTRNWERAEQLKKEREAGLAPVVKESPITLAYALQKYYEASESRLLSAATLKKYRTVRSVISRFAEESGIHLLDEFGQQQVRDLVNQRQLSAVTTAKEIERIRTFFTFCVESEWIPKNPARSIKPPKLRQIPRIPFSETEVRNIIAQAEDDRELAFLLVLRHTGLRIGDAALLRASQFDGDRIYLYTTKAGVPVSVVVPPQLVSLLKTFPTPGGYFFLIGESTHPHTASNLWRIRIKRMCKAAGIYPDHPHRFRHTLAADLLVKGASVEDVAAILGNSPQIVQKHYSQFIKARQDRLDSIVAQTWTPTLVRVK
jgi:site-specific recombinase XerD